MKATRRILIAAIACWFVIPLSLTAAGGAFTIVTKPSLGFTEGQTTYRLGRTMTDFRSSFGPAEKIEEETYTGFNSAYFTKEEYSKQYLAYTKTHVYVNDGVMITENNKGRIKGIIFYVIGDKTMKAASVKTEQGITQGASLREIVKIYGEPFKKTENNLLGYQDTEIYYKYGNDMLSFRFKDGVLKAISMNAEYLPYLK